MESHGQMKPDPNQLFFESLPKATVNAFRKCAEIDFLRHDGWYLAGGTALALQGGHRESVDLDFFTEKKEFDEKAVERAMAGFGKWTTTSISKSTVYGIFLDAKISFIAYPFFKPAIAFRTYGAISILTPSDIAVMKAIAISQRGRKRDFFDVYWMCHHGQSLNDIVSKIHSQYSINQNLVHILKSMVYFEDAESDPEPTIYFDASWKKVKEFFMREIPRIAEQLMR